MLLPLQAASWLMSIFWPLGAVPVKVTVPLTLAAVEGSIGAAVAAGFTSELGEVPCSSLVFSFLLQPARRPSRQIRNIAAHSFLFMMSPFLRCKSRKSKILGPWSLISVINIGRWQSA